MLSKLPIMLISLSLETVPGFTVAACCVGLSAVSGKNWLEYYCFTSVGGSTQFIDQVAQVILVAAPTPRRRLINGVADL
ncbi:protein of unknown function [Magnetospira sp. QH-2]|nr:protein of unknown function [Magnetospira sp. QH-2]